MSSLTIILVAAAIAIAIMPPRWDISVLLKRWQTGEPGFPRGMRAAILPSLLLWAAIALIVWITVGA